MGLTELLMRIVKLHKHTGDYTVTVTVNMYYFISGFINKAVRCINITSAKYLEFKCGSLRSIADKWVRSYCARRTIQSA